MSLDNKALNDIGEADLLELRTAQISENKTLEYKRLVETNDDAKKEFLADISSFANASGGYLVIGMDEQNGIPNDLCGISIDNPDGEILRLENIIRDGISPRIQGVQIRAVDVHSKGNIALVVQIPKSWSSPHMVSFKGSSKFYSRNSVGKYPLDVDEIRSAFVFSETIAERIREFRVERIGKVLSDDVPVPAFDGAKTILHAVPLNSFALRERLDMEKLMKDQASTIHASLFPAQFTGHRRNFDGILVHAIPPGYTNRTTRYVQFFFDGCVEFVEWFNPLDKKTIPSVKFEADQINMLKGILKIYQILAVETPIFVMLSVLNVRDFALDIQNRSLPIQVHPVDREHLIIPEVFLESYDVEIGALLKPAFDMVWNAAGLAGSLNYDDEGNWKP